MKFALCQKRLTYLNVQRNFLLGLSAVLLMIVLIQTLFLFFKREKIIINPPEIKQSYWIKGDQFSKNYVEEMALFFANLLLNVTADNILTQGEVILRYVKPENYGEFKSKFINDEKRLKQHQLSLSFTPQQIEFIQPLIVEIRGILANFVGNQRIGQFQETYKMTLSKNKGQLLLEAFEVVKSEQKNVYE